MKFRRIALTAVTTAAVTAGVVSVPAANAYDVKYDSAADKCTITYTEKDQRLINQGYKDLYMAIAEEAFDQLYQKGDTAGVRPYSQEQRREDIRLVREHVKTAKRAEEVGSGTVGDAQTRLALREPSHYWLYVGLMNASKGDQLTETTVTLTPKQAEDKSALFGLDLKNVIPATGFAALFKINKTDEVTEIFKAAALKKAPQFAAPVVTYNKAMGACANKENDSSSVPEGSAMSIKGLIGAIIGGLVGLLLLALGAGFALRPVVDQAMAR